MDPDVFIPPDPEISEHYEDTLLYWKSDGRGLKHNRKFFANLNDLI